jgi:hypothetical protein
MKKSSIGIRYRHPIPASGAVSMLADMISEQSATSAARAVVRVQVCHQLIDGVERLRRLAHPAAISARALMI